MRAARAALIAVVAMLGCEVLSGCLVMGYSTGAGWWVWPGSLIVSLILLLLFLLNRR